MPQNLNVLYQFNEAYVQFAGASIVSLLLNNREIENITIYVLGEGLSEESRKLLRLTAEDYGRKLIFINTDTLIVKMKLLGIPEYRGSYATNMKLFLTDVIGEDAGRILYLDSDTAVTGSLLSLLDWDMKGCPAAMVLDSLGKNHALKIGLEARDRYYNGGVILFDLKKWKDMKCTERIISHVQSVRAHYMAPDQDLINIVLKGEIDTLPPQYGLQPFHSIYTPAEYGRFFGQKNYYTAEELQEAAKAPSVIHFFRFLGEFPWHKDSDHPYTSVFSHYLALSRWKGYVKQPSGQKGIIFKIEKAMYKHLPKMLFLLLFKINYEYFLWRCEQDSKKGKNNAGM